MTLDQCKKAAAKAALSYILPKLKPEDILGIGTGSTANHFINMLDGHQSTFKGVVASSEDSATKLRNLGINVFDMNEVENLAFYIDGADESNPNLQLIKGGGAALTREKIVTSISKQFICIIDHSKQVNILGTFPLPVEVVPMAREAVSRELQKLGGAPIYRKGVVTDNGGHILDVHNLSIEKPIELETQINQIVGVISNGLFAIRKADIMIVGGESGAQILYAPL